MPEGPAFAALQRGEEVEGSAGPVAPEQVMGEPRPGRTIVITGDTAPSPATVAAAADAELLVHDASFSEEEVAARRRNRPLDRRPGRRGRRARPHVKMLALVHISSRYHVGKVLEEAREVFEPTVAPRDFDLIEIPFPERGEPRARSRTAPASEAGGRGRPRRTSQLLLRARAYPDPPPLAATLSAVL